MKIIKQEENKLLERAEIVAEIVFSDATPSRESIRKELAKELKVDAGLVIIKKIETKYGERQALVQANVYKKADVLKKTETKHMVKRNEDKKKVVEEEKAEEKPVAEEKKPEKKPAAEETHSSETAGVPKDKLLSKKEEVPVAKEEKKEEVKPKEEKK
ncbi:MAG: hypothetical protein KJ583_00870 [Nanoarchaeota archaeon]|nr:hypothetical protein [Nanoarchaeota archaeon]MBU1269339.1 hypothetical protein [Nanoarchaeota archaeon]MBU1603842.1 hypothetical protein [Nanoarchaeota archaeon]MBU2442676.1 hypothetical protein [Nanoarchaeota archaeon]